MDFKGWEKLSADDKTVVMKHPKGHVMTIAIKALPKIQQEQLKRLSFAKGGDVLDSGEAGESEQGKTVRHANKLKSRGEDSKSEMSHAKEEAKGRAQMERSLPKPKIQGLANGGYLDRSNRGANEKGVGGVPHNGGETLPAKYVREGHLEHAKSLSKNRLKEQREMPKPNIKGLAKGGPVQYYDEGAAPIIDPSVGYMPLKGPMMPTGQTVQTAPDDNAEPQPARTSLGNEAAKTIGAINQGQSGIELQAKIDAEKAKDEAIAQQKYVDMLNQQNDTQKAYQKIDMATKGLADYDRDHPLRPDAYREDMSTPSKVAIGIGLALGGFGTAFGGHNYAMDFLDKQIDRDIDAQKNNFERKKTVWGAYNALFANAAVADNLAKSFGQEKLAHEINLAALKQGTPEALARAKMQTSDLAQKSFENKLKAASLLSSGGGEPQTQGNGSSQAGAANQPKDKYPNSHILAPGANDPTTMARLQSNPYSNAILPTILEQKSRAAMSEKALQAIDDLYPEATEATGQSGNTVGSNAKGLTDYVRRNVIDGLGKIPYAGDVITALGHPATDTQGARKFEAARTSMLGALRGALSGAAGGDLLEKTIDSYMPQFNDDDQLAAYKRDKLKQFVRDHTRTDLLETYGLARKK